MSELFGNRRLRNWFDKRLVIVTDLQNVDQRVIVRRVRVSRDSLKTSKGFWKPHFVSC